MYTDPSGYQQMLSDENNNIKWSFQDEIARMEGCMGISNGIDISFNSIWNAYTQTMSKNGYIGGFNNFMNQYDNQIGNSDFNGQLNISWNTQKKSTSELIKTRIGDTEFVYSDFTVYPTIRHSIVVELNGSFSGQGGDQSLPSWLTWTNNGINTAAYGAYKVGGSIRFMKGGSLSLKYYVSAWTGGSRASITTFNLSKLGTGFGYGTSFISAGIGITNFILSDKQHWSDYGRLLISLTSATLTCFPATTGVGIGLGVADAAGGFNGFYNYLDANQ